MKLVLPLLACGLVFESTVLAIEPAPPTTLPRDQITEIRLEDPLNSKSKSYLDLDTGKTFTCGEAMSDDLDVSRRWLQDSGADLMCESRSPADGFVAYDMTLLETDQKLDEINDYSAVAKKLQSADPQPFAAISVGSIFPRTYLFRTREGQIGAIEITAIASDPSGLQLRYKRIEQPTPQQPVPPRIRMRGPVIPLINYKDRIEKQKEKLKQIESGRVPDDKLVVRAKRELKLLEDLDALQQTEKNPAIWSLKRSRLNMNFVLETAKDSLPADSPVLQKLQERINTIDAAIKARQNAFLRLMPVVPHATTQPLIFVQ
jgi:hypothetical protein